MSSLAVGAPRGRSLGDREEGVLDDDAERLLEDGGEGGRVLSWLE